MSTLPSSRLRSLDILRGIAVAGMILVNSPGSWDYVWTPLDHSPWHGLTPTDLVFPFFVFILGMTTWLSLRKYEFVLRPAVLVKVLRRGVVIFALGLLIAGLVLSCFLSGITDSAYRYLASFCTADVDWSRLRILGVLQRLAICYVVTALLGLTVRHRYLPWLVAVLLLGYTGILYAGHGFEQSADNILVRVDKALLGASHLYRDEGLVFDPEGLLSTVPAIAQTLLGFYCGVRILSLPDNTARMQRLFILGTTLTFAGFLLSYVCPINKKIWSPTFVIVTSGLACLALAWLTWLVDLRHKTRWANFFMLFGVNPLFSYVMAALLTILLDTTMLRLSDGWISLHERFYRDLLTPWLGAYPASLAYGILFLLLNGLLCAALFRRGIVLKI